MPDSTRKTDDLMREVVNRAETDDAFRARLLADPAAAVRSAFGVILPHNYRIRFIEKPADLDALIVLNVRGRNAELEDDELDMVAGGGDTSVCAW